MDQIKWRVWCYLFVTSLTQTISQELFNNCVDTTNADYANKVSCNFSTDLCGWKNIQGNSLNWTRGNRDGKYYMRLAMNNANVSNTARIGSPWLCNMQRNRFVLQFRHFLRYTTNCRLSVYLKTTTNETLLIDAKSVKWDEFYLNDLSLNINSTDCFFQIIFEGKKLKVGACGGNNEIGIDDVILTSWLGTEQCTLRTTTTSVSVSHYQPSVSTVVTTQPVSVPQETKVPFTKTSSSSDGLNITTEKGNVADPINNVGSGHLVPGVVAAIVVAVVLVLAISITVPIVYRRNGGACCVTNMFTHQKLHTRSNPTKLTEGSDAFHNSVYMAEDEQNTVTTHLQNGELQGINQVYELAKVSSAPEYSTLTHAAGADGNGLLHGPGLMNAASNEVDYNTPRVNPTRDQLSTTNDTYNHVQVKAPSQGIQADDKTYSLAHIPTTTGNVKSKDNSNHNLVLHDVDEYNRLYVDDEMHCKVNGPASTDGSRADIYNHLAHNNVDNKVNSSPTVLLSTPRPNLQNNLKNKEGVYNHLHAVPLQNTTVNNYDHLQAGAGHSETTPFGNCDYFLPGANLGGNYVNATVNVTGIELNDEDYI